MNSGDGGLRMSNTDIGVHIRDQSPVLIPIEIEFQLKFAIQHLSEFKSKILTRNWARDVWALVGLRTLISNADSLTVINGGFFQWCLSSAIAPSSTSMISGLIRIDLHSPFDGKLSAISMILSRSLSSSLFLTRFEKKRQHFRCCNWIRNVILSHIL